MPPKSLPKKKSTAKSSGSAEKRPLVSQNRSANALYAEYRVWNSKKSPKWHAVKKMRYVFWRMMDGATIQDAIREIRWTAVEFWHLVDLQRNDPFRMEYKRALALQARAMSDQVIQVSEARDHISLNEHKRFRGLIKKTIRQLKKKPGVLHETLIRGLSDELSIARKDLIARNKLQIDALKWKAAKSHPAEFSERTQTALTGGLPNDPDDKPRELSVVFVTPAKGTKPIPEAS